jgi:hypothetical protein
MSTWHVTLEGLRHHREINNSTLELVLVVEQHDENGVPVTWNPWTSAAAVTNGADIPVPGDRMNVLATASWATLLGTLPSPWKFNYRVRTLDWAYIPGSRSAYSCTIRASDRTTYCPEPQVKRQDSATVRIVDRYRDAAPTAATTDGTAITGTDYTEISGKPERFRVSQVAVNITMPWRTDSTVYADGWPDLTTLAGGRLQKVNSVSFLGFEARSLMLVGVDVDPKQDEYVELTWSFLWDSWFHFEQEPDRDVAGNVTKQLDAGGVSRAKTVRWKDMSAGAVDFGSVFTADEESWAQYGWQAWNYSCENAAAAATYAVTEKEPLTGIRSVAVP